MKKLAWKYQSRAASSYTGAMPEAEGRGPDWGVQTCALHLATHRAWSQLRVGSRAAAKCHPPAPRCGVGKDRQLQDSPQLLLQGWGHQLWSTSQLCIQIYFQVWEVCINKPSEA